MDARLEALHELAALLDGLPDRPVGESVEGEGAAALGARNAVVAQDSQVMRDERLREVGLLHEERDRLSLGRERLHESESHRLRQQLEHAGDERGGREPLAISGR